jgi:hypothetical protein
MCVSLVETGSSQRTQFPAFELVAYFRAQASRFSNVDVFVWAENRAEAHSAEERHVDEDRFPCSGLPSLTNLLLRSDPQLGSGIVGIVHLKQPNPHKQQPNRRKKPQPHLPPNPRLLRHPQHPPHRAL